MADQIHTYDKAKWHCDADNFPQELPESHGYTHTGLYLSWLTEMDLLSDGFKENMELSSIVLRNHSPIYLYEFSGGCLFSDMLSDEGNAFSKSYFDFEKGRYLADYEDLLGAKATTLYQ